MPELKMLGTVNRYSKPSLTGSQGRGAARPSLLSGGVSHHCTASSAQGLGKGAACCDIRCYVGGLKSFAST
jgi:hypothetical protein